MESFINSDLISFDMLLFLSFLAVNLVVGLRYGRNVRTINDYALGGRDFSTAALVSTIVATFVTGSGFFLALTKIYSDGLPYFIASCCYALNFLFTGLFVVPRMGEFIGSLSVAEVMGNLYGRHVRLITAISAILWIVGGIAVQFKVFGSLFNYFLGIPSNYAIIIASAIVILYSAFGGIRAVTYTDVLQFFTFGFVIPIIAIIVWNHFQSMGLTLDKAVHTPLFSYERLQNLGGYEMANFILLGIYFSLPNIGPIHFQRMSMGRNIAQVRKAWFIAFFLMIVVELVVDWIPFLIYNINPGLEPGQVTSYIIDTYANIGLIKGLVIIGVSAMAMSSADSFINGSAVLFAHDLREVLNIKVPELILSKVFSIVLGSFAIYLALSSSDLLDVIMTAASFYIPVVTVPLMFAVFGFRSSTKSVLIGMSAGLTTVAVWKIMHVPLHCILFGMIANLIAFLSSHYLLKQPGGWVGIKDTSYLDSIKRERARARAAMINKIRDFNFIEFCRKNSPVNELTYMGLGIYCILYTLTTMYSTQVEFNKSKVILYVYQIMMVTGVLMAMYPIWPAKIKREIVMQVAWNIIIFYMLILFSGFFVMLNNFDQLQFAVFVLNMLIAAILMGWKLGLSLSMIGFYFAMKLYEYHTGMDSIDFSVGSPQFIFIYMLLFVGSALIIFFKPQQELQALIQTKNKHLFGRLDMQAQELDQAQSLKSEFIRNIQHEYNTPMTGVMSLAQVLWENYDKLTAEQKRDAVEKVYRSAVRLESFDSNIYSLSALSKSDYKLQVKEINFSDLLYDRVNTCRRLYDTHQKYREFIFDIDKDVYISGDQFYLTQAIDNMVINALTYSTKGKITITLKTDASGIIFSIADQGIGIPQDELYEIFAEFTVSSKTKTFAGGRGVGLTLCKKVFEVHGGKIKAESDGQIGAKFTVVMPKNHFKKSKK